MKVFIVTGASKGIGAAVARRLVELSHRVVVTARSRAPLEELQRAHPDQVRVVAGDMTQAEVCQDSKRMAPLTDRCPRD